MYDVYPGFQFREYYDYNSDAASSRVYMGNCRATVIHPDQFEYATLELRRRADWADDRSYGTNTFWCYGGAWGYWGRVQSGKYFYQLKSINGTTYCCGMSANPVNYYW